MNVRDYSLVTAAYWGFTMTDGALRMLVLLHFHTLGYSPVQIAFLFLFYEFFGILTNLFGGWLGSRTGLKATLFGGLVLQIVALVMLSFLDPAWPAALSVAFVMGSQALSGIAKDLTKMSSKSAVKILVPSKEESAYSERILFKFVAILTGSKNALKGAGFFLGALLLGWVGFSQALLMMAGALLFVLIVSLMLLRGDIGKSKTKVRFRALFSKSREINYLSAARLFLFGARDVWFVVALPLFLTEVFGWSFWQTGGFLSLWVIGYGAVQASAPLLLKSRDQSGNVSGVKDALIWGVALVGVTGAIATAVQFDFHPELAVVGGLALFGLVFAVNSAVHSYLVLSFTDVDKVALNVGFYYMANACGRLIGTFLSGLVYLGGGLSGCLWASGIMVILAVVLTLPLTRQSLPKAQDEP